MYVCYVNGIKLSYLEKKNWDVCDFGAVVMWRPYIWHICHSNEQSHLGIDHFN